VLSDNRHIEAFWRVYICHQARCGRGSGVPSLSSLFFQFKALQDSISREFRFIFKKLSKPFSVKIVNIYKTIIVP